MTVSGDLSERIAAVLREHQIGFQRCSCGWFTEHGVVWDSVSTHLAERVAELFTEEVLATQPGIWEQPSVHRWVSEWSPVEPEPWEQDWIRESW